MKKIISGNAFHCHHDKLVEFVTNYQERVDYIKKCKPPGEAELRLRLFKMIPVDRLPYELVTALAAYDTAREARDTAQEACDTAREARDTAQAAYDTARKARDTAQAAYDTAWKARDTAQAACDTAWAARSSYLEELHKELCPDCPWNGKTIFPKGRE